VRHIDQNLNRVFCHHDNPTTYEQHIANALIAKIQSIAYDILIDCHSGYTLNAHFVFQDHDDDDSKKLAQATGMDTIIHEWPTLYDGSDDIDTGRYAHTQGKTAITIE
jgi:predicted deacylase